MTTDYLCTVCRETRMSVPDRTCLKCALAGGPKYDEISKASHYNKHPSGHECIEIVRHFSFCLGNTIKYIWRAGLKGTTDKDVLTDLRKARYYLDDEIRRLENATSR